MVKSETGTVKISALCNYLEVQGKRKTTHQVWYAVRKWKAVFTVPVASPGESGMQRLDSHIGLMGSGAYTRL